MVSSSRRVRGAGVLRAGIQHAAGVRPGTVAVYRAIHPGSEREHLRLRVQRRGQDADHRGEQEGARADHLLLVVAVPDAGEQEVPHEPGAVFADNELRVRGAGAVRGDDRRGDHGPASAAEQATERPAAGGGEHVGGADGGERDGGDGDEREPAGGGAAERAEEPEHDEQRVREGGEQGHGVLHDRADPDFAGAGEQ